MHIKHASFFFLLNSAAHALNCFPSLGPLPNSMDCQRLINVMAHTAVEPFGNIPVRYGRGQRTTTTTANIPKLWQIELAHHFNTCAVLVNATVENPDAEETMRLLDVTMGAQAVLDGCLRRSRLLGMAFPGPTGKLYTKLVRSIPRGLEDDVKWLNIGGVIQEQGSTNLSITQF